MTRNRVWCAARAVTVATAMLSGTALADAPSGEDVASARVLGTAGIEAAEKGDCATATPKLEAAEKLFHAPTTAAWLGQCQISLGYIVQGTETLTRLVHEPLAATAPPIFVDAEHRAERLLLEALPRIAKLRVHVVGPTVDALHVSVDGHAVASALLDEGRPTDPGQHQIVTSADGFTTVTTPVSLKDGEAKEVTIKLEFSPVAVATTPASTQTPTTTTPEQHPVHSARDSMPPVVVEPKGAQSSSRVPAIVSFSVGGAGVVAGAISGLIALGAHSTLVSACGSSKTNCPGSDSGTISQLNAASWGANVGFGVGILGAALGTVFLATESSGSKDNPKSAATRDMSRIRIEPYVTNNSLGIVGAF